MYEKVYRTRLDVSGEIRDYRCFLKYIREIYKMEDN